MKNVYIFQVVSEVSPFVGTEDSKRQADQCPDVNGTIGATKMMTDIVYLCMTVVATCDAIICTGFDNLVEFNFAVGSAFFSEPRLQEPSAATAAIVV